MDRSGRRWLFAASGILGAGMVLSAGAGGVSARPIVEQLPPPDPTTVVTVADPVGAGNGANPTISGDGRFVAFQGLPRTDEDARASTIYLTDRETGETAEVTTVPEGQRAGNSIHPVLAGDGCSVVVVTEMALDVFRDDDTGDRWDVYRLRLPHCGGSAGAWELVSTHSDGSGLARDAVDITDPPALSRAGT